MRYLDSGPMAFGYGIKKYRENWERTFGVKETDEEARQGREAENDPDDDNGASRGFAEAPARDGAEG